MFDRKRIVVSVFLLLLVLVMSPAAAQEKIEIKFWHIFQDENRLSWSKDVAAAFNAQFPQYNVVVEAYEKLRSAFGHCRFGFGTR